MTAPTAGSDAVLDRLLSLHPKKIDLTLDRLDRLLAALGRPERAIPPVIHVAGTNGKGSTCAMIRAGLEAAGLSVHVYTSPHLVRFHERIRLAGALIEESVLGALLEECETVNGGAPITFFEITTAAAFLAFARTPADATVLEVGLGGRLDATNVIDPPALTAITPVSIDHQQFLGETLEAIAAEKAGILKPGVPCVVSAQLPGALDVIGRRAERVGAPLLISGRDWLSRMEGGRLIFQDESGLLDLPPPRLPGAHQVENAGAAVAALRALGHDEAACAAALSSAEWPARMQRLKTGPLADMAAAAQTELWLDGGHNEAAGRVAALHMAEIGERAPAPLHLICGMLETKDSRGYLSHFQGLAAGIHAVKIPGEAAAMEAEALADAARDVGLAASTAPGAEAALRAILAEAAPGARVLICGSLYFAGAILRENG